MKIMPWLLALVLVLGVCFVIIKQGETITQQRILIKQMAHNPSCLTP